METLLPARLGGASKSCFREAAVRRRLDLARESQPNFDAKVSNWD